MANIYCLLSKFVSDNLMDNEHMVLPRLRTHFDIMRIFLNLLMVSYKSTEYGQVTEIECMIYCI